MKNTRIQLDQDRSAADVMRDLQNRLAQSFTDQEKFMIQQELSSSRRGTTAKYLKQQEFQC